MQIAQIREQFSNIEQCVDKAASACQASDHVPNELRNCLNELDRESDKAKQLIQTEDNDDRIRQCVDRLEELGDRAMQACSHPAKVDQRVQNEVRQAHDTGRTAIVEHVSQ